MENLYQTSPLLSSEEFTKLENVFEKAWSQDTTYSHIRDEWTKENKAYGQCAITAVIIYDLYGGRLIYDKANFHIWNELPDGTQQDLSRKQFQDDRILSIYKYKTKEDVLSDETGRRTNIIARYQLLKKRVKEELKKIRSIKVLT